MAKQSLLWGRVDKPKFTITLWASTSIEWLLKEDQNRRKIQSSRNSKKCLLFPIKARKLQRRQERSNSESSAIVILWLNYTRKKKSGNKRKNCSLNKLRQTRRKTKMRPSSLQLTRIKKQKLNQLTVTDALIFTLACPMGSTLRKRTCHLKKLNSQSHKKNARTHQFIPPTIQIVKLNWTRLRVLMKIYTGCKPEEFKRRWSFKPQTSEHR